MNLGFHLTGIFADRDLQVGKGLEPLVYIITTVISLLHEKVNFCNHCLILCQSVAGNMYSAM